jgi:hypothetical protein
MAGISLMSYIDCFNGDADGICALTQIRLQNPVKSVLVTGVKRDINLLDRIDVRSNDIVTVLDVSLDKNRLGLDNALAKGAEVFYCDHHFAGEIPEHPKLKTLINTAPDVCTSLLINAKLKGRFLGWAVVGTFGDNLNRSATSMAEALSINADELQQLQNLGVYINYNGYGAALEDLYFDPSELFQKVSRYRTPQQFLQEDAETFEILESGYYQDMKQAAAIDASFERQHAAVFQLPDAAWARRVSGVFGNDLANQHPDRAHAVVTEKSNGNFLISVRAPLSNKRGADVVCRQFATGGGRSAAAGVNDLPKDELNKFIDVFSNSFAS